MRPFLAIAITALVMASLSVSASVASLSNHKKNNHSARYQVVQKLKSGMRRHPESKRLLGQAFTIEAAAFKNRISPFLIVAISGTESTFGRVPCHNNPRNIWGLGACNRAWTVPYFETWKEAYNYYARFLKATWPKATSVYQLYGYCDGCPTWSYEVSHIMRQLWGVSPSTKYPI